MDSIEEARHVAYVKRLQEEIKQAEVDRKEAREALTEAMVFMTPHRVTDLINSHPVALHAVRVALMRSRRQDQEEGQ